MEQEKTRDERIAELLDKSGAEAVSSIKGPSISDVTPIEPKAEIVSDVEEEETQSGGKKVRIPASRLKTLTSKIDELEGKLSGFSSSQERIAALEAQLNASKGEEDLPDWWKEAYGENDISKQGYKNQQRIMREELQRGLQQVEAQRQAAEAERLERIESIEQSFDDQMDSLEESLGRDLTSSQKAELLDIVGEYSPMDGDKYVAYIPVEKAYDIWQKTQGLSQSKKDMATIAGIQSSGSSSSQSSPERPQWGDWRKRFGN